MDDSVVTLYLARLQSCSTVVSLIERVCLEPREGFVPVIGALSPDGVMHRKVCESEDEGMVSLCAEEICAFLHDYYSSHIEMFRRTNEQRYSEVFQDGCTANIWYSDTMEELLHSVRSLRVENQDGDNVI